MAVRIEKGGWAMIFLVGLGLVGYALHRYGMFDSFLGNPGSKSSSGSTTTVDTSQPLSTTPSSSASSTVRVRVNIWVGCVGGLVANGGLDTAAGSIYDK